MSESLHPGPEALVRLVSDLLAQLDGTAVTECEFRSGQYYVIVRRTLSPSPTTPAPHLPDDEHPAHWLSITAPLTGMFYVAESPQSPPLVQPGASVMPGQVVGLIESMKMFNTVESEVTGIVRAIVVANGTLVEAGQVLVYVEPLGESI